MAKALKIVSQVAGVVATVAAIAGNPFVAAIAAVVSFAAGLGAQALTKPPPARGSITQVVRDPDAPSPYVMGEGYFGGIMRHDTGYGATLNKVPNPYRFMAIVYSVAGPIESISPRVDFAPVSSWYSGFLFTDTQLGASPEASALSPEWAGAPGWGASSKLSGQAAIGWSFLFDKDGKRFASGLPVLGAYGQWVKVYDPRLDDTQPGGSGPHRLGVESTYTWSANPALHAGMYAYGRFQNGKRVFGIGLPADGIDWVNVMAWANTCDDNGWTMFGVIYEPGDRWNNLKDICFAGGGEPVVGGVLRFKYAAPVVALDTITADDLTDDDQSVMSMQSFRDRLNTVIPKYRSEAHNWEMVDAEPVINTNFLTEDGEEKRDVWPFNFVKHVWQASQLAAYRLFDTREIAPITLVCKSRLREYRPGECLRLDLPELGLDTDAIILKRSIDPVTMKVTLVLMGETPAKHAFCLGQTGVAPPTPAAGQTAQQRDELAAAALETPGVTFTEVQPFDVQLNNLGEVTTALPTSRLIRVRKGGTLQTTGVTVEGVSATAGITASAAVTSGEVQVDLSAANVSGGIIVTIGFEGIDYERLIAVDRIPASGGSGGEPGGSSFTWTDWYTISSDVYTAISPTGAIVQSNAAGELRYSASAGYDGSGAAVIRIDYSLDGETWTEFAPEVTGTTAVGGAEPVAGYVSIPAATKTGLTASTDHHVRLMAKRSSGTGDLTWSSANFTVVKPS